MEATSAQMGEEISITSVGKGHYERNMRTLIKRE